MRAPSHTIHADTIARTIILLLALINQLLAIFGHSTISFAENDIYQIVSVCWTIVASLTAWWKNNSFTCLACQADTWRKQQLEQQKSDKQTS